MHDLAVGDIFEVLGTAYKIVDDDDDQFSEYFYVERTDGQQGVDAIIHKDILNSHTGLVLLSRFTEIEAEIIDV